MGFGIARADLLALLSATMGVPPEKQTAFLGRFQHLQRLKLVEGINPGRGKAAEYQAQHVVFIAIAMHMLQLGLTPERAVNVIRRNRDRIQLEVARAVSSPNDVLPSMIWFDAAVLSQQGLLDQHDVAEVTLNCGSVEKAQEAFAHMFVRRPTQRMAYIGVNNTIGALVREMERGAPISGPGKLGTRSAAFLGALQEWGVPTSKEIIARQARETDLRILREMHEEGHPSAPRWAAMTGLVAEWETMREEGDNGVD